MSASRFRVVYESLPDTFEVKVHALLEAGLEPAYMGMDSDGMLVAFMLRSGKSLEVSVFRDALEELVGRVDRLEEAADAEEDEPQ